MHIKAQRPGQRTQGGIMGTRPRVIFGANIAPAILLPQLPKAVLRLHAAGIVAAM